MGAFTAPRQSEIITLPKKQVEQQAEDRLARLNEAIEMANSQSAQVKDLKAEIKDLQSTKNKLTKEVKVLEKKKEKVSDIEKSLEALDIHVSDLTNQRQDLDDALIDAKVNLQSTFTQIEDNKQLVIQGKAEVQQVQNELKNMEAAKEKEQEAFNKESKKLKEATDKLMELEAKVKGLELEISNTQQATKIEQIKIDEKNRKRQLQLNVDREALEQAKKDFEERMRIREDEIKAEHDKHLSQHSLDNQDITKREEILEKKRAKLLAYKNELEVKYNKVFKDLII